jgi:diphthamide synthase (EF-2-diphthine--ammonia ligase)
MAEAMRVAIASGVTHVIFGDLFLQDIREYREAKLKPIGITPVFPLWREPTETLAQKMIYDCVEAYIATVDLKKLPASFAGRRFDRALLRDLPKGVDPCGENGEFHTFVAAGPMMKGRIAVRVGETVERDGYAYADLVAG